MEERYKESIDTYDTRVIGCVREVQELVRSVNKVLQERGLSYASLLAKDLYYSFMNLYVILPKAVKYKVSITDIEAKYRELQSINYETFVEDAGSVLRYLDELVTEIQRVLSDIFDKMDEAGLLLRKDWTPEKGERGIDLW